MTAAGDGTSDVRRVANMAVVTGSFTAFGCEFKASYHHIFVQSLQYHHEIPAFRAEVLLFNVLYKDSLLAKVATGSFPGIFY